MDSSTTGTATTSADGSQVTPTVPSPTESAGCEPHGDHWHCDGPAETSSEGDEDASVSETPTEPSPTESVGCEPHGDHWHCEGPVETGMTIISIESGAMTFFLDGFSNLSNYAGAAGRIRSDVKMFAGVVAVAAAACYV